MIFSTDSCLSGCGGWSSGDYFHTQFPDHILNNEDIAINKLEYFAILIAVKVWAGKLRNKNLLLYCDNMATVDIVNKGKVRNMFAQVLLRELMW